MYGVGTLTFYIISRTLGPIPSHKYPVPLETPVHSFRSKLLTCSFGEEEGPRLDPHFLYYSTTSIEENAAPIGSISGGAGKIIQNF